MIKTPVAVVNDFSGGMDTKTPMISMGLNKSPNMRNYHSAGIKERLKRRLGFAKINSITVPTNNLDTHYPPGYQTYDYPLRTVVGYTKISQGFKPKTSSTVTKINLWLKKTGTPAGTDTITLEIMTNSSGIPSGTVVTNGTSNVLDISDTTGLTTSYSWVEFTFSTAPTLVAGTQYHLVLGGAYTVSSTNFISWGSDNYDVIFLDGSMSKNDSSIWTADVGYNACFEVFITGGILGNDGLAIYDFASKSMLLGFFGSSLYKMDKNSAGTPDGTWDGIITGTTLGGTIDYMEYNSDANAQAAYVTNGGLLKELDYMEYSSDANAQAAYVSNDSLDAATKLCSHFDGANNATAYSDPIMGAWTFYSDAKLTTTTPKFGSACLILDGVGDSISIGTATNWKFLHTTNAKWTIDFWIKPDNFNAEIPIFCTNGGSSSFVGLYISINTDRTINLRISNGALEEWIIAALVGTYPNDTTNWYHITIVCDLSLANANAKMAIDGVFNSVVNKSAYTPSTNDPQTALIVGGFSTNGSLSAKIDELRISDGVWRWSSNFTPPVSPYPNDLLAYSEATIKTQGSYALKAVAAITDSLNKTLIRTVSPVIDLTNQTQIKFDIRASRTGSNIKIGIRDSGGTVTEITPNIATADTWQTVTWDISAVANANKDTIDRIIVTILNADAANTVYLDNMFAPLNLQSYSEATIKTQGTYSLKGIAGTGGLNKTLTRTIGSPVDLTGKTTIYFDIYAGRTGANIKIGIHDSGGITTEKTYTVIAANTWETVTWDISGVSTANKDAIDSIIVTIIEATADNTFYIDNLYAVLTGSPYFLTSSRYLTFADWQSGRALINTDIGLYTYTGSGNASVVSAAPIGKFTVIFRNYVFMAGIRGLPNTVRYSDLSDYTTWTAANVLTVNTNDGDIITGMRILKGKLYIFKRYSIHRISYLGSNPTFQIDQILGVGCPAHYTIKEVELGGDIGTVLIFLSTDKKLVIFDGYNAQVINDSLVEKTNDLFGASDDQPLSFADINLVYADLFHAVVKTDTSEYILYCVLGTDTVINYAFVFDTKTGGVYPYDGQTFASSCYITSTNKVKILYCAGYTGYMWQMESGNTDDGTTINAYWVSAKIKPTLVSLLMKALNLGINFKQIYSLTTLNAGFQFRIDWGVSWTTKENFAYNRADALTFGATILFDIGTIENMLQIKISDSSVGEGITLYGLDLYGIEAIGNSVSERATI